MLKNTISMSTRVTTGYNILCKILLMCQMGADIEQRILDYVLLEQGPVLVLTAICQEATMVKHTAFILCCM